MVGGSGVSSTVGGSGVGGSRGRGGPGPAFVTSVRLSCPAADLPGYLAGLPLTRALEREPLELTRPVTVIGGENGSGKSTLVEAVAVAAGFDAMGGSRNARQYGSEQTVSPLSGHIVLTRRHNPRDGWFLRGETHLDTVRYYAGLGTQLQLTELSHGESLMGLVSKRFHGDGLFILDEPEAGLSVFRQLELLGHIANLAAAGAQFIVVTHSPVLMAVPGAQLLELRDGRLEPTDFDAMEAVTATREFIADPAGTAAFLTDDEGRP
ncbi:AAA family ATPase [Corynebacterium frankenforstense]|uniref:AAA family ATPase n=1 Tax=Corynebacterium frankenforstense TaxID=1230998 RepID=UPI0009FA6EC3|nr:AAA family ATPase [Corynebacterium frankenforstense]